MVRAKRAWVIMMVWVIASFFLFSGASSAAPLHDAAKWGGSAEVKRLIEGGADINAVDDDGNSPLYYAVEGRWERVIEVLLINGALIDYSGVSFEQGSALRSIRGRLYYEKGQYDQAIADFTKAIELAHPNVAVIYYLRGFAYGEKGQYEQTIADADSALAHDPKYADAYLVKGIACEELNRNKEAIEAYKHYIKYSQDAAQIENVKEQIAELEKQKK